MPSAFELAASVPAAAAAPSTMTVALLAPVARPRPPISRLLVVPKLPRARLPRLVGSRRAAAVALHAPREINVRALGTLPVAVSYARGRRAGPPAPVRLLCLGLRRGLLDEDRVPREVRRFSHACRPVRGGSPVGHSGVVLSICKARGDWRRETAGWGVLLPTGRRAAWARLPTMGAQRWPLRTGSAAAVCEYFTSFCAPQLGEASVL